MANFNKHKAVYDQRIAKAIFVSALIIVISMILSSCGTVMKRHYMKGYYVGKKQGKNSIVAHSNAPVNKQQPSFLSESNSAETQVQSVAVETNIHKPETIAANTSSETEKDNFIETTKNKNDNTSEDFSVRESKRNFFSIRGVAEKLKNPDAATANDVLSLFWIVIVIILIIYIISLVAITDLASVAWIHALGVIALILLILWLLRVI